MSLQSLVLLHNRTSESTTISACSARTRSTLPAKKNLPARKTPHATKRPRKAVSFAPKAVVVRRHLETIVDPKENWYQTEDYSSFELERRSTISELQRVNFNFSAMDLSEYCLRGLEQNLTMRQLMARRRAIKQCKRAVLAQQLYQKVVGNSDPEQIKQASRKFSHQAAKKAVLIAIMERACSV